MQQKMNMLSLPKKNINGLIALNNNTIALGGGFLYIHYE